MGWRLRPGWPARCSTGRKRPTASSRMRRSIRWCAHGAEPTWPRPTRRRAIRLALRKASDHRVLRGRLGTTPPGSDMDSETALAMRMSAAKPDDVVMGMFFEKLLEQVKVVAGEAVTASIKGKLPTRTYFSFF